MAEEETDVAHTGWYTRFERFESILLFAGVGSLLVSFIGLGLLPALEIGDQIEKNTPETYQAMTAEEQHGFEIYQREGCAYCHSQFVRTTDADEVRWGQAAEAWEYQDQYPQQWGTRRIGPDLSRLAGVYSDDWHLAHLYNPRSTVPDSIMPSYPWLFDEGPDGEVTPTREGEALVAYLQSLGENMRVAGPQTDGEQGKL